MSTFADALRGAMDQTGLSAAELASRSGLTEGAISYLRSGRRTPSFRSIQALSKALPELAAHLADHPIEEQVFDCIDDAIADIRAGKMVIVLDDEDRENEGDLVMAAQMVTPDAINFMRREAGGLICVPILGRRLDELQIPQMVSRKHRPARDGLYRFDRGAQTARRPASRLTIARKRSSRCSIPRRSPPIFCARAIPFPCGRARAACSCERARPKRPSTSRAWPVFIRPASSSRSWTTTAR